MWRDLNLRETGLLYKAPLKKGALRPVLGPISRTRGRVLELFSVESYKLSVCFEKTRKYAIVHAVLACAFDG